jgi:hypothetical protein
VTFSTASRNRLTPHDLGRFPGDTLFDRIGRVVCQTSCLPRKELYEAWEVARRTRRHFRGGRVVDLGGGHGLVAHILLLLDDSSPSALVIDRVIPASASVLHAALVAGWPRLSGRVTFLEQGIETTELSSTDLVVSCHACGALTDVVLTRASTARARVVVLPCCHDVESCHAGPLTGWMDAPMAIDVMRATRLEALGYHVRTQTIPAEITPKNRLLVAEPVLPSQDADLDR